MRTFQIAIHNIHKGCGLDGRTRVERIARVLERIKPDIVALQEVVNHEGASIKDHQASFLAERLGHHFAIGKPENTAAVYTAT
jgi:endonuclease/exonuclease/phosphatase family metal-dependent hydrolase